MAEVLETIKDIFKYVIIIGIIILLRIYVLTTAEVIGTSMEPNLVDGNIMLVDQLSSRLNKIERFDIIVFKYDSPSYLIKRVIGLPGETVKYIDNKLYINNELINEKFKTNGQVEDFEIVVAENNYFVMGDNRIDSVDSRKFGPISKDKIIGKPFIVVWPLNNFKISK